jgi:streptogramin lyase
MISIHGGRRPRGLADRRASLARIGIAGALCFALHPVVGIAPALLPFAASPLWAQGSDALETPTDAPAHTTLVYPPFGHTLGIHRANPTHLRIFLGGRTTFDDPQGVAAVKFASDDDPTAKGDDFQLTLFGVNAGRGEIIYNSSMQTLAVFGREGSDEGQFRAPRGITAHPDGRVYVADLGNRRVVRLRWDAGGRRLVWVGTWAAAAPHDVAIDSRGNVFVADREQDAVLRFPETTAGADSPLLPLSPIEGDRWPLPADVEDPVALAVADSLDLWYRPDHYRLYLVDQDGARLRIYDDVGRVLAETTPASAGPGAGRFGYLALDFHGNVYVTDPVREAIVKFDPELALLDVFSGPGDPEGALVEPRGIAIWRRFGQVFVAEREGARYFFVGADLRPANGALQVRRSESSWSFDIFLTEAAHVTATFLDAAGDTLASVGPGETVGVGAQVMSWDASEWTRSPIEGWEERASKLVVEARPTYSSRKKFARVREFTVEWAD